MLVGTEAQLVLTTGPSVGCWSAAADHTFNESCLQPHHLIWAAETEAADDDDAEAAAAMERHMSQILVNILRDVDKLCDNNT